MARFKTQDARLPSVKDFSAKTILIACFKQDTTSSISVKRTEVERSDQSNTFESVFYRSQFLAGTYLKKCIFQQWLMQYKSLHAVRSKAKAREAQY